MANFMVKIAHYITWLRQRNSAYKFLLILLLSGILIASSLLLMTIFGIYKPSEIDHNYEVNFNDLVNITEIKITDSKTDKLIKTTKEPIIIQNIINRVKNLKEGKEGWHTVMSFIPPAGEVNFKFYSKGDLIRYVDIGENFIATTAFNINDSRPYFSYQQENELLKFGRETETS